MCYLSAEYLLGPHLEQSAATSGLTDTARQAMRSSASISKSSSTRRKSRAGQRAGLGRLAACYLDSLATTQIPAIGYGIRDQFGIFDQAIKDGAQVEITDKWLRLTSRGQFHRPEIAFRVGFGGTTKSCRDAAGVDRVTWTPDRYVMGVAYDNAYHGLPRQHVNLLRLWQAQAAGSFDFQSFNAGDYFGAVNDKIVSENITKVLYPNDLAMQGKVLRLQQHILLRRVSCRTSSACSVSGRRGLAGLPYKFTAQLTIPIPRSPWPS